MRRYIKVVFAAVASLALGAGGAASAADLALKAPRAAPVPLYNWSGCYVGGNAGGAWSRMDTTRVQIDTAPPTPTADDYGRENDSGFMGGAQVGCDFQTTNLVFGVESQFEFGGVKGSHAIPAFPAFTEANNLQQLYLITGRMGYLWTPQLLGYVKVGAAFQTNKNSVFGPGGGLVESAKFTDPGMTAGLGLEYMFMPNWSVFAEADYVWTDDSAAHDYRMPGGAPIEVINDRQRIISAMVGVNYKFHWDGPVAARY